MKFKVKSMYPFYLMCTVVCFLLPIAVNIAAKDDYPKFIMDIHHNSRLNGEELCSERFPSKQSDSKKSYGVICIEVYSRGSLDHVIITDFKMYKIKTQHENIVSSWFWMSRGYNLDTNNLDVTETMAIAWTPKTYDENAEYELRITYKYKNTNHFKIFLLRDRSKNSTFFYSPDTDGCYGLSEINILPKFTQCQCSIKETDCKVSPLK